jgi:hypothetical protein
VFWLLQADIKVRSLFFKGVDDCASECDLDSVKDWDFLVCNNDDSELNVCLERIFALFSHKLK